MMQYQQQQAMQQYYQQQALQQQYQHAYQNQVQNYMFSEPEPEPEPEPVQEIHVPKLAAAVQIKSSDPLLDLVNNNMNCYQIRPTNTIPTHINSHATVINFLN